MFFFLCGQCFFFCVTMFYCVDKVFTMPKSNICLSPSKSSKVPIKKTTIHKKPKKVPLKIIPVRHSVKAIWANRTHEQQQTARKKQCSIAKNKSFRVPSKSATSSVYDVICDDEGVWTCTCPDFMYRSAKNQSHYGSYCKHVAACIDDVLDKK